MKRLLLIALIVLGFPLALNAQSSYYATQVLNAQGVPTSQETVRVCQSTITSSPCLPLTAIYGDQAMTQQIANPMTPDALGNIAFYATPGYYKLQFFYGTTLVRTGVALLPATGNTALTASQVTTALSYVPLNSQANLGDIAVPAIALQNIGGASKTYVDAGDAASAAVAASAQTAATAASAAAAAASAAVAALPPPITAVNQLSRLASDYSSFYLGLSGGTLSGNLSVGGSLVIPSLSTAGCLQNLSTGQIVSGSCPSGSGSASFTANAIQFAINSSTTRAVTPADLNTIFATAPTAMLLGQMEGPRVDVTHPAFGADGSYVTGQNPACTSDNSTAFIAAVAYSQALASVNQSAANLYVPPGCYNVNSSIFLHGTRAGLNIEGDGSGQTTINYSGTSGFLMKYRADTGTNITAQAYGRLHIKGITLQATGHLTGATLLEVQNIQNLDTDDVALKNTGGICLNVVNVERATHHSLELDGCARSINANGSSNETYYYNTHILSPGVDLSGYAYNGNPNVVSGAIPTSGAVIVPSYNQAVTYLGGQDVNFDGLSCKPTTVQGCLRFFGSNQVSWAHGYFEAFGPGTQNADWILNGPSILSIGTSAISSSALNAIPVNGALYQPMYVTDQASIANFATNWTYDLEPPDFILNSTATSVIGGGILKGTRERVTVAGFYGASANGAGQMQLAARGLAGTTAVNWPAGFVVVLSQTISTDATSRENHYNGNLTGVPSGDTAGCSQNTLNANWLHSTTIGAPVGSPALMTDWEHLPQTPAAQEVAFLRTAPRLRRRSRRRMTTHLSPQTPRRWLEMGSSSSP
jgi:hypothetical protein